MSFSLSGFFSPGMPLLSRGGDPVAPGLPGDRGAPEPADMAQRADHEKGDNRRDPDELNV